MKRKELFRRLSAISMAAMMTVTAVPSNIFAADIEFTDSEQETTEADAETAAGRAGGYESPSGGGARRRAAEAG